MLGSRKSKIKKFALTIFLMMLASTNVQESAAASDAACDAKNTDALQYLIFWGLIPQLRGNVDNFKENLGTTGDGKTRQLGFGDRIPFFMSDELIIPRAIHESFNIAKRTNIAVHFNVDDHVDWVRRPDLWNWYDPAKKGYDPANRKNVEWYDWEGTPNKRRYFTPEGAPSQSPHMCYNSPAVQKEITRIVSQIVGPALRKEIAELAKEHREYLFAGITVGQEPGFDDYSKIPPLSEIPPNSDAASADARELLKQASRMMNEDEAPHSKVGYCALTNDGYSRSHPPANFNQALVSINQRFAQFWDQQFVEAGIACSLLYTHVPAPLAQDDNNDAPISIAFNPYARPGWTTYPVETLANGLQPIYRALAERGVTVWGGVEANATPNPAVHWEGYLASQFNHGAKLVGINSGASDATLMSHLTKGAFGDEAMAAYRKFLRGDTLIEK